MQQAKVIKEKRELAQELGRILLLEHGDVADGFYSRCDRFVVGTTEEDVQSFERSVLSGPQSSEANANTGSESDSAGKDSDAEVPVKRKVRAIQDLVLLKTHPLHRSRRE